MRDSSIRSPNWRDWRSGCEKTGEETRVRQAKLGNDNSWAPPAAVVAQERERLVEFERTRAGLERQLGAGRALGAGQP